MTLRNTIKKILLENNSVNKRYDKFAYNVIKYAYDNIRNYYKERGSEKYLNPVLVLLKHGLEILKHDFLIR